MLGDWMLTKLCGEFVTDPSLGSSSGMFELAQRDWSDRVLEICGLDRSIFPHVVEPGTVVGGVTAALSLYFAFPIPPNGSLDWSGFLVLAAGETLQALAGTSAALSLTVSGVETS